MSDLKLASDGATRRYDLRNTEHGLEDPNNKLTMLAWLGEYDLLWDEKAELYTVVKERPSEGAFTHNFTDYAIDGDNLIPVDRDVILDPYHMCLLYQAHEHFDYGA